MVPASKRPEHYSWASDRELIALAKTKTLELIVKTTGRKPMSILKTAKRLGITIRGRKAETK